MVSPLRLAKQQLRKVMKQRLSHISKDSVLLQSQRICETLQNFRPYNEASRISIYLAMPAAEVQTDLIVRHALKSGKQVFVPYLHKYPAPSPDGPSRAMDMVKLSGLADYEKLQRDSWGIPSVDAATIDTRPSILGASGFESSSSDPPMLDLMLMPGVAFKFDPDGSTKRLGHGKGFYDFFIARYMAQPHVQQAGQTMMLFGLALTEQVVQASEGVDIPVGEYDRLLDGLIVGDGEIKMREKYMIIDS